jgi:hypothetical protein
LRWRILPVTRAPFDGRTNLTSQNVVAAVRARV